MFIEFETPLQVIEDYIINSVMQEITDDGLLSDVKSTKTIFKDLTITDVPAVWIYLSEWNPETIIANRGNSRAKITYPVEICIITNKADLQESDQEATSIQARIVESLIKNWKRVIDKTYKIRCHGVDIKQGYSDGKFKIANKQQKVVIKGLIVDFIFELDWMKCLQIAQQESTNDENNGG